MGGKVAPRVATAEPSVAGLVILAGDAQPMHRAAIRVIRYLASLNPGLAADAAVETITWQAAARDRCSTTSGARTVGVESTGDIRVRSGSPCPVR